MKMNTEIPHTSSSTGSNPCSSSSSLHPLNVSLVVDEILTYFDNRELREYRAVCHTWNDLIVRKVNKSRPSFRIPLRYGPEVPQFIVKSNAQHLAGEILENVISTLTGSAARLTFDTVVIDREFYLAGLMPQWTQFLEIQGAFIRHLKFKIRRDTFSRRFENYVTDCDTLVSMENLRATFSSTPNLESLNFCIRFCNYVQSEKGLVAAQPEPEPDPMFLHEDFPQLNHLQKITIRQPKDFQYSRGFLIKIIGMAPHLTSLNMKPTNFFWAFGKALKSLELQIKESLTSISISKASFVVGEPDIMHFPFLHLTTLEFDDISKDIRTSRWITAVLQVQHSTLVKVILGNRKNIDSRPLLSINDDNIVPDMLLRFPPVMENLQILEMNFTKFRFYIIRSYQTQFPVLESLTFTGGSVNGNVWDRGHIRHLLPMHFNLGSSFSLKQFSLIGPMVAGAREVNAIVLAVRVTFPMAECHFDTEGPEQYSRYLQRVLAGVYW